MGMSREESQQMLPPKSYLHVEEFARPVDLARFILYINNSYEMYKSYFEWQYYFDVRNEHGYFKTHSYHYCRLCEALNYNSREPKSYDKLEEYWNRDACYPSWDAPTPDISDTTVVYSSILS